MLQRPEKGISSSAAAVLHGCEPPCGGQEANLGPLQEQQVLSTADPTLQPRSFLFIYFKETKQEEAEFSLLTVRELKKISILAARH